MLAEKLDLFSVSLELLPAFEAFSAIPYRMISCLPLDAGTKQMPTTFTEILTSNLSAKSNVVFPRNIYRFSLCLIYLMVTLHTEKELNMIYRMYISFALVYNITRMLCT